MTLTEFLLARIAEDEVAARQARDRIYPTMWSEDVGKMHGQHVVAHVERHAPDRVLAECETKRRIVADLRQIEDSLQGTDLVPWYEANADWAAGRTLRHLAAVYADHPDYQQEWSL